MNLTRQTDPFVRLICLVAALIAGSRCMTAQTDSASTHSARNGGEPPKSAEPVLSAPQSQGGLATYLFLARKGHANGAIVIGKGSGPSELLLQARAKVLSGSRSELEYVIYKTEGLISYFDVLAACYEARITLDRAWLGLIEGDRFEFRLRLDQCQAVLDRADRLAREAAGRMIAYADDPTERYLLLRYNRNVIASIENGRKNLAEVIALQENLGPTP